MNIERWVLALISVCLLALAVCKPADVECEKAIQYLESKGTRYER